MPSTQRAVAPEVRERPSLATAWTVATIGVVIQIIFDGRYGYFRDELYFIVCSRHLAVGYVDFAPLIAWLARGSHYLLGDSLHAIRLLPALAFGTEVLLAGMIVRELGGRRWAMLLGCVSVTLSPVILNNGSRLSMNPIEPVFWMGCIFFVLRALNDDNPKLLLWCGVMLGFGLENKHSTVFFIAALMVGMIATPARRLLVTRWFWFAALIAAAIAMPNFFWQVAHHFPTLEDLRNVKATHKNVELPPLAFLGQQIMMLAPHSLFVWLPGLAFLLLSRKAKEFRFVGITYVAFLVIMMALKAKDYYLAPIYPMLFAAGAVWWEQMSENRRGLQWIRSALPIFIIVSGLVTAPMVLPILPPAKIAPYLSAFGVKISRTETTMSSVIPQYFADEFGWEEMVQKVASVYNALPPEERKQTAILGGNYGGAAAIDFFGPKYGLPKSISAHQNYYYWGPRDYTGHTIILLEWPKEAAEHWCGSVEEGPRNEPYYGMGWEHYTILVCHGFKKPLAEAWPELKFWN